MSVDLRIFNSWPLLPLSKGAEGDVHVLIIQKYLTFQIASEPN